MTPNLGKIAAALLLGAVVGAGLYAATLSEKDVRGLPALWGDDPKMAGNASTFKPTHFAVLYMQFQRDASKPLFKARHAYFTIDSNGSDKVGCAIDLLKAYNGTLPPGNPCGLASNRIREDFDEFNFGKQMRVYAFVDNTNIAFNENTPISFTPFGAFDTPASGPNGTKKKNKSFYDARTGLLPEAGTRKGLMFNNFLKNGSGGNLNAGDRVFHSINFNLLLCKGAGATCDFSNINAVIPTVIDPDGGNMGGGSPPP